MFIQYRRCQDSLTRRIMKNSLLIEVFSRDLFNFTRGVTEHFSTVPVKGRENLRWQMADLVPMAP